MTFLFAALFFTICLLITAGILLAVMDSSKANLARRLLQVQRPREIELDSGGAPLIRDDLLSAVPVLHRVLLRLAWSARLKGVLDQAGRNVKPGKFILWSGVLALAANIAMQAIGLQAGLATLFGLAIGCLPFSSILYLRVKRFRKFEREFPEAIDLLVRALRAGHAFSTGLEMIARELSDPVAGEFRAVFEEHSLGLPLRDALLHLTRRMPLINLRFFVAALLIQKDTGGNLAEVLDNLSQVIRERFKIRGEVAVRTAQGRLTAVVLILLPPALVIILTFMNPGYVQTLFLDPLGQKMLAVAVLLQVLGSALLWKIVQIEV
jgi:tight adherence protein B